MIVNEIRLYELLKARIGDKEAEAFVGILESRVDTKLDEKTSIFATKEDIAKLETKIAESKVDIIKWMVATAIAVISLVIAGVKLL